MGNRVLEEGWYDESPSTNVHKTVLVNDIRGGGGCGSNSGEPKAGEVRYNASDTETSSVQYVHGKGQGSIVQEMADNGTTTVYRYRHEDQAGRGLAQFRRSFAEIVPDPLLPRSVSRVCVGAPRLD